jgi:uncharacterized membrane protein YjfL (UPF0719 family)
MTFHSFLAALPPVALEDAPPEGDGVLGAALGLALGLLQLIVSLALFTLAINQGIAVVSRMIEGLDLWDEIRKKNVAVGLLAAGAVIAYTNVVAGGIAAMTEGFGNLARLDIHSGLSAMAGGAANLIVALAVAGVAISWTFKIMDRWTKGIDEKAEFRGGNVALGVVHAGVLIGASELIAAGVSGVSAAVTGFFAAIFH